MKCEKCAKSDVFEMTVEGTDFFCCPNCQKPVMGIKGYWDSMVNEFAETIKLGTDNKFSFELGDSDDGLDCVDYISEQSQRGMYDGLVRARFKYERGVAGIVELWLEECF